MALTYDVKTYKDSLDYWGKHVRQLVELTLDASYPAGGYTIDGEAIGVKSVDYARVVGGNAAAGRLLFPWDHVNKKLMAVYPSGGDQDSPAALADPVYTLVAGGAADNDTIEATPGRGKEVLATTDLSSIKVLVEVIGIGA